MVDTPKRTLFVEGGGNNNDALKTECRRGFSKLLEKAGFKGKMPRIVACGGRKRAFDMFSTAVTDSTIKDINVLFVDSEEEVKPSAADAKPWEHVKNRRGDSWKKPEAAIDDQLHFMVECMENWFLSDKETLANFFGQGFKINSLPANQQVENISKSDVYKALKEATKDTHKGTYGKGRHSFKILAEIDPSKLMNAAPYAKRLFEHLEKVLG
jgi:Domain of unknown function (DUF4276)